MWSEYDHYIMAFIAIVGTLVGAAAFLWLAHRSRFAQAVSACRGLSPPFVNVVGVLFALTLAFIANDTWLAHDRAIAAVQQEAGALRTLKVLAQGAPPELCGVLTTAVEDYARRVIDEEWPQLVHRQASAAAGASLDALLTLLAGHATLSPALQTALLEQAIEVRRTRDARLALSQAHVNPLKWLGMGMLGYLTLISIAMVYGDQIRVELLAVVLFSLAAGPTAAIVLIQANPFQGPAAISAAPIAALFLQEQS